MPIHSLSCTLVAVALLPAAALAAEPPAARAQDGPAGYSVACSLVDQAGISSCADLPAAAACARESELASPPSRESTAMTFVNRSEQSLQIFWLDFQGYRVFYRNLVPHGRFEQKTFIGHNWLVTSRDGRCIGIFKAAPESVAFF
jgi:hypothetical protein